MKKHIIAFTGNELGRNASVNVLCEELDSVERVCIMDCLRLWDLSNGPLTDVSDYVLHDKVKHSKKNVIIMDDVLSNDKAEFIKKIGGIIIGISKPTKRLVNPFHTKQIISKTNIDIIINNCSLENLKRKIMINYILFFYDGYNGNGGNKLINKDLISDLNNLLDEQPMIERKNHKMLRDMGRNMIPGSKLFISDYGTVIIKGPNGHGSSSDDSDDYMSDSVPELESVYD